VHFVSVSLAVGLWSAIWTPSKALMTEGDWKERHKERKSSAVCTPNLQFCCKISLHSLSYHFSLSPWLSYFQKLHSKSGKEERTSKYRNTKYSSLWLKLNRKLKAILQLNCQIFIQALKRIRILFHKSSSYFFLKEVFLSISWIKTNIQLKTCLYIYMLFLFNMTINFECWARYA